MALLLLISLCKLCKIYKLKLVVTRKKISSSNKRKVKKTNKLIDIKNYLAL